MNRATLLVLTLLLAIGCGRDAKRSSSRDVSTPRITAQAGADRGAGSATIPPDTLADLSLLELQHARATIFGRHGRAFEDSTLQRWLAAQPWYRPDPAFSNERLTAAERAELDRVRAAEAARHPQIESGDLRFHATHVITTAMLGTHSPQDWEVLAAEVLANHGFVFEVEEDAEDDSPRDARLSSNDLQRYFDARYWYRRDTTFWAGKLSAIEQQNLDTIRLAMTRQLGRAVSPGMMNLFENVELTDAMLDRVSISDLRLLRNEIYARRGRAFTTDWLQYHFRQQPWYSARADFQESDLTPVERGNVAAIVRRERRMHDELGTRLLVPADLADLPAAEARRLRNEIYARHGRRFRDAGLQRYFESFDWYHPRATFSEASLNDTERRNATLIGQYESGRFTEG